MADKRGRGRPKKDITKALQHNLRLTEQEDIMLDTLAEKMGVSRSEVIRKGLAILGILELNNTKIREEK